MSHRRTDFYIVYEYWEGVWVHSHSYVKCENAISRAKDVAFTWNVRCRVFYKEDILYDTELEKLSWKEWGF